MQILISVAIIIIVNIIFQFLGEKIKIPAMVVSILLGWLINISFLHEYVLFGHGETVISILGDFGLIALMFIAGLGSSIKQMKRESRPAALISFFGFITPLLIGIVTIKLLGYNREIAFLIGIVLSITAEATTAKTLFDANKLNSKVGTAMLEAGIIDDIVGLVFFICIGLFLNQAGAVDYFFIFISLAAFLLGAFIKKHLGRKVKSLKKLEHRMNVLIIPFLFINIGIHFDFFSLGLNVGLLLTVIGVAFVTKILGCLITKPFVKFSWKQLQLIGYAMNSRGAIGLAILLIGFQQKIIPIELYSSLIVVVVLTTLAFPFLFQLYLKRDPHIMEK